MVEVTVDKDRKAIKITAASRFSNSETYTLHSESRQPHIDLGDAISKNIDIVKLIRQDREEYMRKKIGILPPEEE